jgi:hypothetical protein
MPTLRVKNLPVLLSRCFEVIALFFLAVDFFLRILWAFVDGKGTNPDN